MIPNMIAPMIAAASGALLVSLAAYVPMTILLSKIAGRRWATGPFSGRIAILVAARDEEESIADKLRNVLADPSLPSSSSIIVVADGCRDRTVEIARGFSGIRVDVFDEPGGKARRFNEIVPSLDCDVVVFTDATARWEPGTIGRLLEPFADPEVGGAGAVLAYQADENGGAGATTRGYFDLEARVRRAEALLASSTGFSGSLYAVRQKLFLPLAADANEDFQAALDVARVGARAVVADAVVTDAPHASWESDFRMRRRVIARAVRALAHRADLVRKRPVVAVFLVFHKVLRFLAWALVASFLGGVAATVSGRAASGWLTAAIFLAALAGGGTLARVALDRPGQRPPDRRSSVLLFVPHLVLAQLAAMLALADALTGHAPASWSPDRSGGAVA